jgi:serine protease Do
VQTKRRYGFALVLLATGVGMAIGALVGGRPVTGPSALAAAGSAPFAAAVEPEASGPRPPDFAEIVRAALPAVVTVRNTSVRKVEDEQVPRLFRDDPFFHFFFGPQGPEGRAPRRPRTERRLSSGSGFIISEDGYVLTNQHVIEGATRIVVTLNDGERYDAKVVGTDRTIDLALLKIDPGGKKLPALPLGDSDKLQVGEWVIAIGNPIELQNTVTVGVVSGKGRRVPVGSIDAGLARFIQTDAAINFGNSGGPLLDVRGRVVGINTAILRGEVLSPVVEGIGFAIPINEARAAAEQLRASGSVERGFLGITMNPQDITEEAKEYYRLPDTNGVIVAGVEPRGPAAKAGIERGDIIRKVNGEPVRDSQDLLDKIASRRPGERVELEVFRDGRSFQVTVTLGKRPLPEQARLGGGEEEPSEGEEGEEETAAARRLGISVQALTDRARAELRYDDSVEGVLVTDVEVGSPAEDEGIRDGNVISAINGKPIRSVADWNAAIRRLKEGDVVQLEVVGPQAGQRRFVFLRVPKASEARN